MANRWWTYQAERFPVFGHGLLICAFSFCAVSYSHLLRGAGGFPPVGSLAVAFVSCFLFFLQLRIADEFKDFAEDSKFRPYRPVPRGLVKLRELAVVFALAAAVQLGLALLLQPRMALLLLVVWTYLAAMSKEFFVRKWLQGKPITYMLSHMLIMPLIDFYATSCDWLAREAPAPRGLLWFLIVSFFNGLVIEIGRKIRSPVDEETGVNTYSVVWGRLAAVITWLAVMAAALASAVMAAEHIGFVVPLGAILAAVYVPVVVLAILFLRQQKPRQGKVVERLAGVWTLVVYLSLGAIPLCLHAWGVIP